MTGFIIFLAILLLFVSPLFLKTTLSVEYDGEIVLLAKLLFIKIKLYPRKEKKHPRSMSVRKARRIKKKLDAKAEQERAKKAEKKKEKAERRAAKKRGTADQQKKTAGEILDILSLAANLVRKVVGRSFRYLRVKLARIKIKVGTGDAATTAIAYGAITQSVNIFFPLLEDIRSLSLPSKADDIQVIPDFTAEESEIDIKISFSIRVWQAIHLGFTMLFEFVKYFFKVQKREEEQQTK